jgi:hypothetical protein
MTNPAVEEAIIQPLLDTFPPPSHIRGKPAAIEALLNVYRRALDRFERTVLEQAWQKVAAEQTFWVWPLPETLVKAAKHFQGRTVPQEPDDWVERATKMADSYARRYMLTTQTATRARDGGYEAALKRYVLEASWVQAQFAVGRQGAGYDHGVLFPARERDKADEQEWFEKAREQARTGHIRVSVPRNMVEQWAEKAESQSRKR